MHRFSVIGLALTGYAVGCSGHSTDTETSVGGASNAVGGTAVVATGGAAAQTGGRGAEGGDAFAQSSAKTGGKASTGGSTSVTTGGAHATGGSPATGGSKALVSTGGALATGGSNHTGGALTTGGATTGSTKHTGGGLATGGAPTGGSKNTGGALATGGAATGGAKNTGGASSGSVRLPTANASFDYQIGGAYTPPSSVQVVSRDRNSAPAAGLYNICYVNGFQAQPDEESFWTNQHPDLLLRDGSGNIVIDQGWDEMLLDTSTSAKRSELATVVGGWITKCASDGFNAVEIDNLDSYSRSNGLLTQANNVAFMALLSATAHASGLAIAQKNSTDLLGNVSTMGTDFAIAEECNRYSECTDYQAAYGNLVFVIEYRSQDFQKGCTDHPELSIVLRDLNVSPAGSSGYVYQGC